VVEIIKENATAGLGEGDNTAASIKRRV